MNLKRVMRISRPRFWIYELGPYLIGILAAMFTTGNTFVALERWRIAIFALYFVIAANIWIYGINDIYDYETDKLNPKKQGYEALVEPKEHRSLRTWILCTTIPFMLFLPLDITTIAVFALFLFFSAQYSATPIRAKSVPLLDMFFSAGHYIATALFGFLLVAPSSGFNRHYVIAGLAWAMAMHAYSAVPDIQADKDGGVATVATLLHAKPTLILCFFFYGYAGIIGAYFSPVLGIVGALYCILMIASYIMYCKKDIFMIYKRFPWINTLSGMILFFLILTHIL